MENTKKNDESTHFLVKILLDYYLPISEPDFVSAKAKANANAKLLDPCKLFQKKYDNCILSHEPLCLVEFDKYMNCITKNKY